MKNIVLAMAAIIALMIAGSFVVNPAAQVAMISNLPQLIQTIMGGVVVIVALVLLFFSRGGHNAIGKGARVIHYNDTTVTHNYYGEELDEIEESPRPRISVDRKSQKWLGGPSSE